MPRCHPPRPTLWITGIGEPDAVAPEDRQHSFQHVAQLPQTLRALHSAADLVHAFQKPETVLAHWVGALTFGDDFVVGFHKMPYFALHIVGGRASFRQTGQRVRTPARTEPASPPSRVLSIPRAHASALPAPAE